MAKPKVIKRRKSRRPASPAKRQRRAKAHKRAVVRAAAMMPKSPARLRDDMLSQKRKVRKLELRAAKITDRRQSLAAKRALQSELRVLASLVTAAKTKKLKKSGKILPAAQVRVSAQQGKQRKAAIAKSLPLLDKKIRAQRKKALKLRPGKARASALTALQAMEVKHRDLRRRYLLLSKGRDQYRPKALRPGVAKVGRRPLVLPVSPKRTIEPGISVAMVRLLSSRIPKRAGESRRNHNNRLRSYTKRAMVRYWKAEEAGIEPAMATEAAVMETLSEDMAALESEADAGGTVQDAAADAMEENVVAVESQLEEAAIEAAPEAAAKMEEDEFVTPEVAAEVQADLSTVAEAVEQDADIAAVQAEAEIAADDLEGEVYDIFDLASDELLAESDYEDLGEDPVPWWQNPYVVGAGALAAVVLVSRRR